ncbi:MAG TPA: peptidylprolyl isomerase [Verrucomicrobiae bacterium]|nr:peptidylprolyl isomerase [Verrucomicrobiae bacterium]
MKKMSQLFVLLGAAVPLAVFSVTPDMPAQTNASAKSGASLDSLFGDAVVAKGKGIEVKRSDLDAIVVKNKAMAAARQMQTPPDMEQQALKTLIIQQLFLSKATDADRAKGKENYQTRLAKVKSESGLSDADFEKRISMQLFGGETREQWDKQNIDQLTIPVVLERELNVHVTDDEVKKFYEDPANISKFEQPETVRVSHILLMTKDPETQQPLSEEKKAAKHKQMEDLLKRARAGEDFAKLADQYSEDPGVKENHGEYKFTRNDPFVQEFKDTAFSLTNGQVSDIITSQFGYHILKLHEKIPAKKVDFDKVKDGIKDYLTQQALQKQLPDYTKKLEKDADIQILDEKLKGVNLALDAPEKEEGAAPAPAPAPSK